MEATTGKRPKAEAKKRRFSDLGLRHLRVPKQGQVRIWDSTERGLSVLLSAGGAKTFCATFNLHGKTFTAKLKRVKEMTLEEAREQTREYRTQAAKGIDPRKSISTPERQGGKLYKDVVAEFIEHYAKPRQRTWDATQRTLAKGKCADWLERDITTITAADARTLQRSYVAEGHTPKAQITYAWLRKLWRWACAEGMVATQLMDQAKIEFEPNVRDRTWNDAEIKAIWQAAEQLDSERSAYIKLLLLLAPRKTALAALCRSHLRPPENPTLWVTPFELTKSKKSSRKPGKTPRTYLTPLPPLAQRILKGVLRQDGGERVFPTLPIYPTKSGVPRFDTNRLTALLIKHGAPADFQYHTIRHTIATWLENQGHSDWERGLVLNHAGTGVTADYSHGYPLTVKLDLLSKWAAHVEGLVQPEGVALLR